MPIELEPFVDSLDAAPVALRDAYVERDGKFFLNVASKDGFALEDVSGLKTALGKERTTRETLEKQVIKFKDIDPDKAREALAKLDELAQFDPAKEADKIANTKFEAAKAQLVEKHSSEITTRDQRISHLTKTVESLLIDSAATAAIAEAKGSVDLLLPHVRAHTRVKEVDGNMVVEVLDKDGNVKIADAKGTPQDIKGLIAEMKASDIYSRAFEASGQSGSGKQPNNGSGGAGQLKRSQMSPAAKAEYIREQGQEAFLKLPK